MYHPTFKPAQVVVTEANGVSIKGAAGMVEQTDAEAVVFCLTVISATAVQHY